jgi:hypothetical protein
MRRHKRRLQQYLALRPERYFGALVVKVLLRGGEPFGSGAAGLEMIDR